MAILTSRIWYVCNKCGEWFSYDTPPKICPDCNKGDLVKTCAFCGETFEECKCSKEKII